MTKNPCVVPFFKVNAYNCPHCHAYSKQDWGNVLWLTSGVNRGAIHGAGIATCDHCNKFSVWIDMKMVFPLTCSSPFPNSDLPDDIKEDYEEARNIQSLSPRGAAALLRLCVQKLCIHLGEEGKNINKDIASLVSKGLPIKVQQALDLVRVVGNNAVHPGKIDLNDDAEISNSLFLLVNIIADVMLTQPKHIEEMYNTVLPDSQRKAIEERDKP